MHRVLAAPALALTFAALGACGKDATTPAPEQPAARATEPVKTAAPTSASANGTAPSPSAAASVAPDAAADDPGESFGVGGLGLTSPGEGGEGIGLERSLWDGGRGIGTGPAASGPRLTMSNVSVRGRLPPEVVQRIVRQSAGRYRSCYGAGLVANKWLAGTVIAKFEIARDGSVHNVTSGASTLSDPGVVACVLAAFGSLAFPSPEAGTVFVTAPIDFQPPPAAPKIHEGAASSVGRLPPDVVKRIVRQNFGRIRQCYTIALAKNPKLAGTVTTTFVIEPNGAVSNVADAGSSLADAPAIACVVAVLRSLAFPEPEGGKVTVTYPINFAPE